MANDMMNRRNDMMDAMNDWFGFPRNFFDDSEIETSCNQMLLKLIKIM